MVYHEVVKVRDSTEDEEFGPEYFEDTLACLENKVIDDGLRRDDPEFDLIHSQEFIDKLRDILGNTQNRELIRSVPIPPMSVLRYLGMVASPGNSAFDLYTYDGVMQYHKKLFSDDL